MRLRLIYFSYHEEKKKNRKLFIEEALCDINHHDDAYNEINNKIIYLRTFLYIIYNTRIIHM